jgi:hypothetical protein
VKSVPPLPPVFVVTGLVGFAPETSQITSVPRPAAVPAGSATFAVILCALPVCLVAVGGSTESVLTNRHAVPTVTASPGGNGPKSHSTPAALSVNWGDTVSSKPSPLALLVTALSGPDW